MQLAVRPCEGKSKKVAGENVLLGKVDGQCVEVMANEEEDAEFDADVERLFGGGDGDDDLGPVVEGTQGVGARVRPARIAISTGRTSPTPPRKRAAPTITRRSGRPIRPPLDPGRLWLQRGLVPDAPKGIANLHDKPGRVQLFIYGYWGFVEDESEAQPQEFFMELQQAEQYSDLELAEN